VIIGSAGLSNCCPSISAFQWTMQTALILAYMLYFLRRNLGLNIHLQNEKVMPALGAANWITLFRGGLIAFLAGFLFQPWPGRSDGCGWTLWIPGVIYTTAAACDIIDGYVARMTANQTRLGEILDTKMDALGLLVASLLAISYGQLPIFYISVGAAYYILRFAVWLRKRMGKPCSTVKRRSGARLMAAAQMGFVGIVLLPLLSPPAITIAAVFLMTPFLAGFFLDWQNVCGHEKFDKID